MKTSVRYVAGWCVFTTACALLYSILANNITDKYIKAEALMTVAQRVLELLTSANASKIPIQNEYNVIVFDKTGNVVIDKYFRSDTGKAASESQQDLYAKMRNKEYLTTHISLDSTVQTVSAVRVYNDNYTVIVYI